MDFRFVSPGGLQEADVFELDDMLLNEEGFVWIDIADFSDADRRFLSDRFGFHPVALDIAASRNHMPMVHGYADHMFAVLHRPVVIDAGHVHLVEIDMFLGQRYLVTVHPAKELDPKAVSEVDETIDRIKGGRIHLNSPAQLAHAIISLVALRQRLLVQRVAERVNEIETKVLDRAMTDPESSLDEMFMLRYELLSVRTAAAHSEEIMARARRLPSISSPDARDAIDDLEDMFRRVHRMTDHEQEFLAGVIDLYRARTDTKMMIATERLAVLAAVTLPVTAIASVYGMNVIVNPKTEPIQLTLVILVMLAISLALLRWTKRLGWW
jgi:Mg2+ and Co2+ transporter CorA